MYIDTTPTTIESRGQRGASGAVSGPAFCPGFEKKLLLERAALRGEDSRAQDWGMGCAVLHELSTESTVVVKKRILI